MTLSRATEASYRTGRLSIAWAPADVLRSADRGLGHGAIPFLEGSSCNYAPDLLPASWQAANGTLETVQDGPDGGAALRLTETDYLARSQVQSAGLPLPAGAANYRFSWWIRTGMTYRTEASVAPGISLSRVYGTTGAWTPFGADGPLSLSGDAGGPRLLFSQGWSSPLVKAGVGETLDFAAVQMEPGPLATSFTTRRCGVSERAADVLSAATIPAELVSSGFRLSILPSFGSHELPAGVMALVSLGVDGPLQNGLFLESDGTTISLVLRAGGQARVSYSSVTFVAGAVLNVIVDRNARKLTVFGDARSGSWNWPTTGTLRIGHDLDGLGGTTHHYFGRMTELFPL